MKHRYRYRDDPHDHCDHDPVNCTHARLLDILDRYRTALDTVAECHQCPGCRMVAVTATVPDYEPD
jgi:hypothetical protein